MGLSPEQRKARARDLCISEYGIDPEARITDNPELPPLPAADHIMWQHGQQTDHYSPVQMRAYAAEAVRVARLQALEEAAKVCDIKPGTEPWQVYGGEPGAELCESLAEAIRAMKPA